MRSIGPLLLAASIFLLGGGVGQAQETDAPANRQVEEFDEFAREYRLENDVLSMSYPSLLFDQNAVHHRDLSCRPSETEGSDAHPYARRFSKGDAILLVRQTVAG